MQLQFLALEVTEAKPFSVGTNERKRESTSQCVATMSSNVQVAPFDPFCVSLFVFVDETTKRYNLQSDPFFVCITFDFYVIMILFFLN